MRNLPNSGNTVKSTASCSAWLLSSKRGGWVAEATSSKRSSIATCTLSMLVLNCDKMLSCTCTSPSSVVSTILAAHSLAIAFKAIYCISLNQFWKTERFVVIYSLAASVASRFVNRFKSCKHHWTNWIRIETKNWSQFAGSWQKKIYEKQPINQSINEHTWRE